jgi:hypothetical protein
MTFFKFYIEIRVVELSMMENPIRSKSLWRWHINTIIMFLDIIHRHILSKSTILFIFQNNVSETGLCLRFEVKSTQLGPISRLVPVSGDLYEHQDVARKRSRAQRVLA